MFEKYFVNVDLAKLTFTNPNTNKTETRLLGWGGAIEIENPQTDITDSAIKVKLKIFQQ